MRKPFSLAAAAVLAGGVLFAGPVTAVAVDPPPLSAFKVGEPTPPGTQALPGCSPGGSNMYVLIAQQHAVVVDGSGHYVQEILVPGQRYSYPDGLQMIFEDDGRSMTWIRPGQDPVTEVC